MRYIECLGVHGSGKSTVAKEVVTTLRARQLDVLTEWDIKYEGIQDMLQHKPQTWWRLLWALLPFSKRRLLDSLWWKHHYEFMTLVMLENPSLVRQVLGYVGQFSPPAWMADGVVTRETLLSRFFYWASMYSVAKKVAEPQKCVLIEEGFCQQAYNLIAFRKSGFEEQELKHYLQYIPKPQLLVFLTTAPEVCVERLQKRPKYPRVLEALSLAEKIDLLSRKLRVYEEIADFLARQGTQVIRLKNDDFSENRRQLTEQLVHFQ